MLNKYGGLASYEEIKNVLRNIINDEDQLHNATNDLISNFYIYPLEVKQTVKWYHRLNMCWILPMVIIFNCFKWVVTGRTGVEPPSKMGKLIAKLIGGY